jgi:hypothetical protein
LQWSRFPKFFDGHHSEVADIAGFNFKLSTVAVVIVVYASPVRIRDGAKKATYPADYFVCELVL